MNRVKAMSMILLLLCIAMLGCTRFIKINEHGGELRGPDCDCYQTDYAPKADNDAAIIVE